VVADMSSTVGTLRASARATISYVAVSDANPAGRVDRDREPLSDSVELMQHAGRLAPQLNADALIALAVAAIAVGALRSLVRFCLGAMAREEQVAGPSTTRQHDLRRTAGGDPADPNSHTMAEETRLERRLDRAVHRASTPRGAAIVIASASTVVTVVAGVLVTVVEHKTYPSIGTGLWWAAQTVTTVGYGDNIPTSLGGRLVAVLVMFMGIGFLTVVTAAITSTFVAQARRVDQTPSHVQTAMVDQLRQLDSRLEGIEAALDRSSSP
jgi:hypothetical protein